MIKITSFEALSASDVRAIIESASHDWQDENQKFYGGDHFQDGGGWFGPGPAPGESGFPELAERVGRRFVAQNAIKGAVDTKVNAALGHEARWGMVPVDPQPEEDEQIEAWKKAWAPKQAKADAILTKWWDKRGIHKTLQNFATIYELEGRALLRLFVPPGLLDENGAVPTGDLAASLSRIYVEAVRPKFARIYTHRHSMQEIGIYLFQEEEEYFDSATGETRTRLNEKAELTWIDANGKTVLRTVGKKADNGSNDPNEAAPLDLNGNLWHFQAEGEPLITEPVRSLNKLLNLALTTSSRNLSDNGWLEEFLINCEIPGAFETIENEDGTKTRKYNPSGIQRGPGQIRSLVSKTGVEKISNQSGESERPVIYPADVKWRPPVDPHNTISTKDAIERAIAQEVHQRHTLKDSADGNASGEALKQHRAEFLANLNKSVAHYNAAGRWLLETVLALAVAYSNDTETFKGLRPNFECRIDAGPLSADELREISDMVEKGLISRETGMAKANVDDVDAEMARIENESNLARKTEMAALLETLTRGGAGIEGAAKVAEFSKEDVAELIKTDLVPPNEPGDTLPDDKEK